MERSPWLGCATTLAEDEETERLPKATPAAVKGLTGPGWCAGEAIANAGVQSIQEVADLAISVGASAAQRSLS